MTTAEIIALASAAIALGSAAAAWGAILTNRRIAGLSTRTQINTAARSSRAAVVSANRQRWIDAIRDDVAEILATRDQAAIAKFARGFRPDDQGPISDKQRELRSKVKMLLARIDMRLNHNEDDHIALIGALARFDQDPSFEAAGEVRDIARKIFKLEWERLKKEASGIDPFVREASAPISPR